ncbi:MAG: xanthine dehydrogenase family protein subunit M [Actinomycetota bacterium]
MKAPPFSYHRPTSLDDALALLAEHGDDAKVLAGGQSFVPLMALRMARPAHVIDIGAVPGLADITVGDDGSVTIGAMVRHATAERSDDVARHAPLVAQALPWVGHRAIRSQGTVVGSIAHADPAAEMPAVGLATGATMTATSADGERVITAADFFDGYLTTTLRADEILTSVTFPAWSDRSLGAVVEVARRHGDYALVGVAARLEIGDDDVVADAALAFFGAASTPIRVPEVDAALVGRPVDDAGIEAASAAAREHLDPPGDIHGTTAYRKHLGGVLVRRAVSAATTSTEGAAA